MGSFKFFRLIPPLALALTAPLLLLGGNLASSWSSPSSVCDDLRERLGAFRPGKGRLSCDFEYAPESSRNVSVQPKKFGDLSAKINKALADDSLPQRKADLALADLAGLRPSEAVGNLTRALALSPDRSEFANDLTVALFVEYEAKANSYDLLRALWASSRAIAIEPDSPVSRFNSALALEGSFLFAQAEKAWRHYLELDSNSPWAEEARSHLKNLEQVPLMQRWDQTRRSLEVAAVRGDTAVARQLLSPFHQQVRELIDEEILPQWGRACLEGRRDDSSLLLTEARALGEALKQDGGDALAADAVASISAAESNRNNLALGHKTFGEGVSLYKASNFEAAFSKFGESYRMLSAGASPFRYWALVKRGFSLNYLGKLQEAYHEMSELPQLEGLSRYPALLGRARIVMGIATGKLGRYSESSDHYRAALSLFESAAETENIASSHFMLGEILQVQGETKDAWSHRYKALALVRELGRTVYLHLTLSDASDAALKEGFPESALLFQAEELSDALARNQPVRVVEALLTRARTLHRIGDLDSALRDLDDAATWLAKVSVKLQRMPLEADLWATRGDLALSAGPLQAIELFTKALSIYHDRGDLFRLPTLYAKRGQARAALADFRAAEADFESGIESIKAQRDRIVGARLRESFLSQARATFDAMIRLQGIDLREYAKAFEYAEMSRAQNLLSKASVQPLRGDLAGTESGAPPETLARDLPAETALVEYVVLEHEVMVWVVTNKGLDQSVIRLDASKLEGLVSHFVAAIQRRESGAKLDRLSGVLYTSLLAPLQQKLSGMTDIVIVPDKFLCGLPFASLRDPRSGRYLIEDVSVSYSPSAALLHLAMRRQAELAGSDPENILVIGNPTLDREQFPDLANLRGGGTEAEAVAALYPESMVLAGAQASEHAFLAEAPDYSVIHVAAHVLLNWEDPMLSGLVLARSESASGDGVARASEVYKMRFTKTKLVILAGCETAAGEFSETEGVESLVTPFLAAGVPAVVANLWRVDDGLTEDILIRFHRYRTQGHASRMALRRAQLDMLHSRSPAQSKPYTWAGFEMVGSS
jgi:CHAT domain-containing protein